ncbi:MAG: VOC family protein [Actinomycetota bacterium]|nr:VOC family protein [Actinomycetota bacterium]
MFVNHLDLSANFYCELLGMDVTVLADSAALLVGADSFQLYLRSMGPHAQHAVGNIGVQYVIWTAVDEADLRRCEHFLKDRSAHVRTETSDGFTFVEGRDPSGAPVMMSFPGPDQTARHHILSRIYTW